MKNTSNALRRVMSVVLVFAMMFTSMPTGALAEDVVDPAPSTTAAERLCLKRQSQPHRSLQARRRRLPRTAPCSRQMTGTRRL